MVRTREKKAKGDSAFTKQKQKVGRKKLAPATATRAEVHARTLRLATSTTMSAAMAAPHVADPLRHPASSATTTAGQKAAEDKRKRPVVAVQNFAELLSGTHHYKAANRASAFATLTRLLQLQRSKDDAVAAMAGSSAAGDAPSAFDEYMRYEAAERAAAATATTTTTTTTQAPAAAAGLTGLTPLEKLKAFAAALEAVTDTDDDVRRGALQSLAVLVDYQWISPHRDGAAAGPSSSTTAAALAPLLQTTQDAAELRQSNALLLDLQAGHRQEAERVLASSTVSAAASTVSVDRVQAVLQAVHVALTHAMKPVRLAGVELLALLLRVAPAALVRAAARAVCRHQTSYYYSSAAPSSEGLTMAGVHGTNPRQPAQSSPAAAALQAAQTRAATLVEEEEKWMLTLVRRVSTLVLRTPQMGVLPALLDVFLGPGGDAAPARESALSALLRGCLDAQEASSGGGGCEGAAGERAGQLSSSEGDGLVVWRHPELVNAFFDEMAPQWANHWKELMELRLELLRQEEKLTMATALARSFATVLVFLKRQHQQQQQQGGDGDKSKGAVTFFSRNRMYFIKGLFIEKMPVTMQELLIPAAASGAQGSEWAGAAVNPRSMKARLELGLALVMVCVPLAGTDEGWHLMRDYFSIVFSVPRTSPPQPLPLAVRTASAEEGESPSSSLPPSPPPPPAAAAAVLVAALPFRFPSLSLLELSVQLYEQVLRLYPCVAAHIQLSDDGGSGAGTFMWTTAPHGSAAAGGLQGRRSAKHSHRAGAAGAQQQQQQQQHSTVALRLLSFFPALMQTVVKHVVPRTEGGSGGATATSPSSAAAASEDAALVRTLLCTTKILERLAAFPDELLRGRKGAPAGAERDGKSGLDGTAASRKLAEGFKTVTRLFFALRAQTLPPRPATAAKRSRDDADADSAAPQDGGIASSSGASAPSPSSPTPESVKMGVLLAYPAIVDALVRRLLHVLWLLSSSGHPLLRSEQREVARESTAQEPQMALAEVLKRSLVVLFGPPQQNAPGMLRCCAAPTILLAHSTMMYLGSAPGTAAVAAPRTVGVVEEVAEDVQPFNEAAATWASVTRGLQMLSM